MAKEEIGVGGKPILRKNGAQFVKGTGRPLNSGLKKGQKLRNLTVIINELEAKLQRNCDPVVSLLELAAGHDALAEQAIARYSPDRVDEILETPGWQLMTGDDAKERGWDIELHRLMKDRHIPRDLRVDAAKAASRFVRPILAQTEISGPDQGAIPVAAATFPAAALMKDEEAVALLEKMQIGIAEATRKANDEQIEKENEE